MVKKYRAIKTGGHRGINVQGIGSGLSFSGANVLSSTGGGGTVDFAGALVRITTDQSGGTTGGITDLVRWEAATYDTTWDPDDGGAVQRFWLGADFTFINTDVNTTNNTITEAGHGFVTGEGPFFFTTSSALPGGITAGTKYWAIRVDADTFKIATSRSLAIAGTAVDITTQGTGTQTCDRGKYIVVPAEVTRMRFSAAITSNSDLSGQLIISFYKNNSVTDWVGNPRSDTDTSTVEGVAITSPVLVVTEGDYFAVSNFGSDAWSMDADTGGTFFAGEVVTPMRVS